MLYKMYEKAFFKNLKWFALFSLIAVLAPFAALLECIKPQAISESVWFARSGAITIISALAAEIFAIQIFEIVNPRTFQAQGHREFVDKYKKWPIRLSHAAFILIAVGTFLTAYGDLFFST